MDVLLNPIVLSVILLSILCLLKLNVMFALVISCIVGGVLGGLPVTETMSTMLSGFYVNAEAAMAYILLGTLASCLAYTGLMEIFTAQIAKVVKGSKFLLISIMIVITIASQTIIPLHTAFIPILIPPLLILMNKMKMDRRLMSGAVIFGMMPYVGVPIGYGLIFMNIVADSMSSNGLNVSVQDVARVNWMLLGFFIPGMIYIWFRYNKPREYENIDISLGGSFSNHSRETTEVNFSSLATEPEGTLEFENAKDDSRGPGNNTFSKLEKKHWIAIISLIVTTIVQIITQSLSLAGTAGLLVIFIFGAVKWKHIDARFEDGIRMMGNIAFVMLVAGGFGQVMRATGGVEALVTAAASIMSGSKLMSATIITLIGLIVTMGIGTSFGTIPILAVLYVPLCTQLGFSPAATIILISAAGALGDAGSPASDATLGATAGLNADGQHDHIWDTCVPSFLIYNLSLMIGAIIIAQFV